MKFLGHIGPEQTPFYVKRTKLGAPLGQIIKRHPVQMSLSSIQANHSLLKSCAHQIEKVLHGEVNYASSQFWFLMFDILVLHKCPNKPQI